MKKNAFLILSFVLLSMLADGCTQDDNVCTFRKYPKLKILPVSDIRLDGATFNAEITFKGDYEVISYGFFWGLWNNPDLETSTDNIIIKGETKGDTISLDVLFDLYEGHPYHVRAFIETEDLIIYSDDTVFISAVSNLD